MEKLFSAIALFLCTASLFGRLPTHELKNMAISGDFAAMVVLGARFLYGDGETKDLAEAERWYRMAAVRRDFEGAYGMGTIYVNRKDYITAFAWFSLYADEEAGLNQAKNEILSIIPKARRLEAIKAAAQLNDAILKETAALLQQSIEEMNNTKS